MITAVVSLFILAFGGSTYDVVKSTHKVETVFRAACFATGGDWINLHKPGAACVGQDSHLIIPEKE